jgi:gliding motility-associated lipoprotein GldH
MKGTAQKNGIAAIFFSLLLSALCSCDPNKVYEDNVRISKNGWHRADRARFETEITDTVGACNLYINVRNTDKYKYMELWLFVDSRSPEGTVQRDTVKIMLADHRGKWYGKGLGDKYDNRIPFHKNVRFPASGTYVFELEQATRDEPLIGIEDVGLRLEKNEE